MPFVNIRLIEGRSHQQKDEISKRVTNAIRRSVAATEGRHMGRFRRYPRAEELVCWQRDGRPNSARKRSK